MASVGGPSSNITTITYEQLTSLDLERTARFDNDADRANFQNAVDWLKDVAVFSIFRRSSEMPLFRVEKRPRLRARQGQYAVIAAGGQILKRGHELTQVLRVFDSKLIKAVEA